MAFYLLKEDGGHIVLEQSGPDAIILEQSPVGGTVVRRKLTVIGVGYCLAWFFFLSEVF